MYPSYNNGNSYPLDPSLSSLTYTHETPHPPPSSSFYNFPSPAMPYEDDILLRQHLHDLLLQHPAQPPEASPSAEVTDSVHNSTESVTQCQSTNEPVVPRKKPSKKDRHSKIETAQGPRDRRMRLSLEVAPQFFGLQDMLGFDKASKTVGWLLSNSKNAIRELKKSVHRMTNSSPCNSEGEDGNSGTDDSPDRQVMKIINPKGKGSVSVAKEKKTNRGLRKCAFDPQAKESREKARARARERTRERRSRVKFNEPGASNSEGLNHELNPSGSWNALENGDELGRQSPYVYPSLDFKEPSSSINIFSYDPNVNRVSRENHFMRDYYQVCGKPWETYSNTSPF